MRACMPCIPRHTCESQRTAPRSWVSPSTMWSWGLDSCQAKSAQQSLNSYFWGSGIQDQTTPLVWFLGRVRDGRTSRQKHRSKTVVASQTEKREAQISQSQQWPKKLPLGLILKSPQTNHYFNHGNKHKWLCLFNSVHATFLESAVMFIFNFFFVLVSPAQSLYNFFHVYIYHHLNKNLSEPH